MSSIPLLTTDGDAHARGVAHGRRFAEEIAANVATYLRRFAASGLDRVEAFVEAETWRKAIAALCRSRTCVPPPPTTSARRLRSAGIPIRASRRRSAP
jgi:hypothetical protein